MNDDAPERFNPVLAMRELVDSREIGGRAALLALSLIRHADDGGESYPAEATLGAEMGRGRDTVIRAIAELEAAGWLLVDRSRRLNRYRYVGDKGRRSRHVEGDTSQESTDQYAAKVDTTCRKSRAIGSKSGDDMSQESTPRYPSKKPKGKEPKKTPTVDDGFERFYAAYPRKVNKPAAGRAWKKVAKKRPPTEELIAKLEQQKLTRDWQKESGQYIPHPASWLNGERWDDEVRAAPATEETVGPDGLVLDSVKYESGNWGAANHA